MSNSQILVPNLLNIVDNLHTNRKKIASKWVQISTVKYVFKAHKISARKFTDRYGIPIIEHFIAVVRKEKEVGNCPVMSELVNFLLEKDITPKDVFDICMGLRRTFVAYLFKAELIKNKTLEVMEEVATLFDANLSGVLAIFTGFYADKQQKIQKSIIQQKKFNEILKIINFINTKIVVVQSGRIIMGNKSFFDMLGLKNLEELYKKNKDNFSFMKNIDGTAKHYNIEEVDEWFKKINERKKPFKTDVHHSKYNKIITYSGRVTTLPDSEPTKYILSLNSISSLIEDEAHMRERLEHDELTGLNNYVKFEHLMGESHRKAIEEKIQLALVIVDVPQLKEINQQKGMDIGDKTLINVANGIRQFTNENMIIARLEGSRFGILMSHESEQESYDWCCALHIELSKKPERKTISITAFDLSETVNSVLMRAYNLIDLLNSSDNGTVMSDFENIELYEALPDQEQFTNRLRRIKNIKSIFYYKGLAVTADNKILYTDKNSATIMLSNKEFSIALAGEAVYLEFPFFGVVKANIESVDDKKMTATLHKFRLNKKTPLKREKFRVDVKKNMHASILSGGIHSDGVVFDVNEQYIALRLKRKRNLNEGSYVYLEIMLQIDGIEKLFNTEATIEKIQKIENAYKVVLLCHLDNRNKNLLKQYIANRQMEIISELKNQD